MPKTEWSPADAERTVKLATTGVRRVQRRVRQHRRRLIESVSAQDFEMLKPDLAFARARASSSDDVAHFGPTHDRKGGTSGSIR